MSLVKTIAKNTLFNFITHASDVLINFGVGILLARFLGPSDYGLYSFLIWFLYFAALFVNLGLGNMVIRYVAESLGQQNLRMVKSVISLALWLRVAASILVIIVVAIFAKFWSKLFGNPGNEALFIIISIGILPHILNFLFTSIFSGFQKYEYGAYLMLGTNPLRALGIIIVCVLGFGVREIILVSISSWVLGVFIGLFLLRRLIPLKDVLSMPRLNPELKGALKYSMIMTGVLFLSYFMTQRAEVLFLGIYQPEEQVGFYTIAFLMATSSIGLILMVFSQVLIPSISEQFGQGDMGRIRAIYTTSGRYLMMLGFPLAMGGIALAGPIINLIYGAEYAPAIPVLQVLLIPFALLGISDAATSVLYGINQPSFVLKTGLGLVIISIGLDLVLIPKFGAMGAAIGSSVARVIAPFLYIWYVSRKCETSWPMKDTWKISLSALIMATLVYILQLLINIPAVAVVLLLPLGVILHFTGLIIFGVIRQDDVSVLKRIQDNVPGFLRGIYKSAIRLIENRVQKSHISNK
jgi:O-antigen/teichoic acid export membrane protein